MRASLARPDPLRMRMGLQGLQVTDIVFWVALVSAVLAFALPPLRSAMLVTPFLVLFVVLADRGAALGDEMKPLAVFMVAGIALLPLATTDGVKDLYLSLTGVAVAFLLRVPKLQPGVLVGIYVVAAAVFFAAFGLQGPITGFSIAGSESPFESNFGFIFPMLAIHALLRRRPWAFFFAVILAVATLKRIALLGLVVVVAFHFIGERRGRWLLNPVVMVVLNLSLAIALVAYGTGYLDKAILEITGQSANQFGLGRRALLYLPSFEILSNPLRFALVGAGPGTSYELAARGAAQLGIKANLHSDLIKIVYEYGLACFAVIIGLMYAARSYAVRLFALYLNVLFISDNTLIYGAVLFIYVYCARQSAQPPDPPRPRRRHGFWSRAREPIERPAASGTDDRSARR